MPDPQQEQQQQQLPSLPPKIQEELRNFRKLKRPKVLPRVPDYISDSPLSELGQLSLTESVDGRQDKQRENESNLFSEFMI